MSPEGSTKEPGRATRGSAEAMSCSLMETLTKVSLQVAKLMEKEPISGEMERSMMESGTKDRSQAMVSGKASMGIPISASGKIARLRDMESMSGLMETGMRVNGIVASDMEMEQTSSQMEIIIPDSIVRESPTDLASTNGLMATHILVSLLSDRNMARVNGRRDHPTWMTKIGSINMMGTMRWIRNTASVLSNGSLEISIKVTITTMSVKDMERCSGLTAASSKVTGFKECNKE